MSLENVNDDFFEGSYKEIWRRLTPPELTLKEIEFMVGHFGLKPGMNVLDLMCGYGRHTIGLARLGLNVTAIDNLKEYYDEIGIIKKNEGLAVSLIQDSVLKLDTSEKFDLIICMGNSLNFFDEANCNAILSNCRKAINTNGSLLINTWSIAEIAVKYFKEKSWGEIQKTKLLYQSNFKFKPTRIESNTFIIEGDNIIEKRQAVDYIFSISEFEKLLTSAGFELVNIFSSPQEKAFVFGDAEAYLIAQPI